MLAINSNFWNNRELRNNLDLEKMKFKGKNNSYVGD